MSKIVRQSLVDISYPAGKTKPVRGATLSEPCEQHFLAAYLVDLLPETARHSDDAVLLLKRAVAALDPQVEMPDARYEMPTRSGAAPVAALSFAVRDLKPGTGPHLWVTMAIDILKGHRPEALGTS